jgi:hypothetical protein
MGKLGQFLRKILKFLFYAMPVIFLFLVLYIFCLRITKNRVYQTQKDIVFFVNKVKANYENMKYKDFNADYISYSEFFPMDVKIKQTEEGNEMYSRFGGKMLFLESPRNIEERRNYFFIKREEKMFNARYDGLSAYIVVFTELRREECIDLARVNWKAIAPNVMGIEASYISRHEPYNGVENLNDYLLEDNPGEDFKSQDKGEIHRQTMTKWQAMNACDCLRRTCTVALKFY